MNLRKAERLSSCNYIEFDEQGKIKSIILFVEMFGNITYMQFSLSDFRLYFLKEEYLERAIEEDRLYEADSADWGYEKNVWADIFLHIHNDLITE